MEVGGIGFATGARGNGNAYGAGPPAPSAPSPGGPAERPILDNGESNGDMGALAAYSAAFPLMPGAVPNAAAFAPSAMASASGGLPSPSPSSFTPARSWTSLAPQGGSDPDGSGASADQALADLVGGGGGDVFDSDS